MLMASEIRLPRKARETTNGQPVTCTDDKKGTATTKTHANGQLLYWYFTSNMGGSA
jgi:hypothetical protein